MNIKDLYGKKVISNQYGEGVVLHPAGKNKLCIQYSNKQIDQVFPSLYPKFFQFKAMEDDKFSKSLTRMNAISSSKLMKDAYIEYKLSELSKRSIKNNPAGTSLNMVDSSDSAFIKLEGTTEDPEDILCVNYVKDDDGTIKYLLNFSRVGANIQEDDQFFICKGYGKNVYIYGRGIVSAFSANNIVKESWIKQHSWMKEREKYVIVKEFEILATELTNCPTLMSIYEKYGGKVFSSQENKETNLEDLARIHNQKSHMFLSETGYKAFTSSFIKHAEKYGTYTFETEA